MSILAIVVLLDLGSDICSTKEFVVFPRGPQIIVRLYVHLVTAPRVESWS
jgi:hypothetical protein